MTGCGRLILNNSLPKILPFGSGSTAVAFYIIPQIPDKWLLSGTEKHWTFTGREVDVIPEEGRSVYQHHLSFLQWQRQGLSTALLTMTSSVYIPFFLTCL